jgi:hypothetical protein
MISSRKLSSRWAVALGALGLAAGAAPLKAQTKDVLTGTWGFNRDKTVEAANPRGNDRLNEPETMRSGGGRVRAGTGVAAGGATAEGAGNAGAAALAANAPGPLGMYARPQPQLVIVQTDSTITVSDPSGSPRTYFLDGRKQLEPLIGTDTLEVVARWKDGKLTADRKLGHHGTIREIYSMDAKKKELVVEVRITAPTLVPPISQKRIYDFKSGG